MGTISKSYISFFLVARGPLGFKLFRFRNFLTTQHPFSSYVFSIAWTAIFWPKQISKHVAGRASGHYHEAC